jgi:sialic acid synthase SpsE
MFKNLTSPFIIAEVADAHYGSLDRAKEMAVLSKKSGATCVKFQHHLPDEEMLREIPNSSNMKEPLYEFLLKNALNLDQHIELAKFCENIGILYLCTPFSWKAAEELETYVDPFAYKIGSGELTDIPTILRISRFAKPVLISTGMSEIHEITRTYEAVVAHVPELVLMNCTSAYPPKFSDIQLGFIPIMKELYPAAIIGHSDHTPSISTAIAAVGLGADVIEKHVTIDRNLVGPDDEVSIDFNQLKELASYAGEVFLSRGKDKRLLDSEKEIQLWARRSVVVLEDLPIGSVLSEANIWGKRPGTGIPSWKIPEIVGKRLCVSKKANTLLELKDFE